MPKATALLPHAHAHEQASNVNRETTCLLMAATRANETTSRCHLMRTTLFSPRTCDIVSRLLAAAFLEANKQTHAP